MRGDGEAARVASRRNGELAREEERRGFHLDEDVACVLLVHASDLPTHAQKRELEAARGNRGKAAGVFEAGGFPPSLSFISLASLVLARPRHHLKHSEARLHKEDEDRADPECA